MKENLTEVIELARKLSESSEFMSAASEMKDAIIDVMQSKGLLMVCGNGGSATQASHMVGEIVGRFAFDRPPLRAVSLYDLAATTAIGNDYGYEHIFDRFVEGVGSAGDALLSISTSGNSMNCLNAMFSAKQKGIKNFALIGGDGGKMKEVADCAIIVPGKSTPRIQEIHLMVIHWICQQVEFHFFAGK